MDSQVKTLGYLILDHNSENEGYCETSLERLVEQGHIDKLPILNRNYLENLSNGGKIGTSCINKIKTSPGPDKIKWSPTAKFLYQMFKLGRYEQLEIPQDKMLITANRKIVQRVIEHLGGTTGYNVLTKLKTREYGNGRELLLSSANKQERQQYFDRLNNNKMLGHKFNFYLVNDDCESQEDKRKFTLFSIHALVVGSVCFVYEAEIDAIEKMVENGNNEPLYSVLEVKTEYREADIVDSFKKYEELNNLEGADENENTRALGSIRKRIKKYSLPFLQGELGNVDKFVYGFDRNDGFITTREFRCFPGTLFRYDLRHLRNFVTLLENTEFCSPDSKTTWNEWEEWKLLKCSDSIKLYKAIATVNIRNQRNE